MRRREPFDRDLIVQSIRDIELIIASGGRSRCGCDHLTPFSEHESRTLEKRLASWRDELGRRDAWDAANG